MTAYRRKHNGDIMTAARTVSLLKDGSKYSDQYGVKYHRVTNVISKYFQKFDTDYMARKKAKDYGWTEEQVKSMWNKTTETSLQDGNMTHNHLEMGIDRSLDWLRDVNLGKGISSILSNRIPITSEQDIRKYIRKEKFEACISLLESLIADGYVLFSEVRVYNTTFTLCGTIDVLGIKGKEFVIIDWKTNKYPITSKSGYYKNEMIDGELQMTNEWKDLNQMADFPISHLTDSLATKYFMQVNVYSLMCYAFGLTQGRPHVICHIRKPQDYMLRGGYSIEFHTVPDYYKEAFDMLDHHTWVMPKLEEQKAKYVFSNA